MMASRQLRKELGNDSELAVVFDRTYSESLRIWDEQYLREFTTHGREHTEQVERNLDSLTRPLQNSASPLTAEEIFILLSAACLHDIGMQRADDPDARKKHAQYAYDLILHSHARLGPEERRVTLPIDDGNARIAIAKVARAHWTEYALQLESEDFIVGNTRGRLKLLGLLLAMADLLDLSRVRARFFRSPHRLFDLSPVSELHHTMHELVKGVRIVPPNPVVPSALQFRLEWFDNCDTVHTMSEWVMQWFHSQWKQLEQPLFDESGGTIGWAKPKWAEAIFNPPQGPVQKLSNAAGNVLAAERAEQTRINRDAFAARFHSALDTGESVLFLFTSDSDFDWRALSDWCEAVARIRERCRVARINSRPSAPTYISGLISQLMEQWDEHLPQCADDEALEHLASFVLNQQTPSLISIIRTDEHGGDSLRTFIQTLLSRADSTPAQARVCLLISPGAQGPKALSGVSVVEFDGSLLQREEVEQYLQLRHGYSPQESSEIYDRMLALKLTSRPASVYTYIETHCGL